MIVTFRVSLMKSIPAKSLSPLKNPLRHPAGVAFCPPQPGASLLRRSAGGRTFQALRIYSQPVTIIFYNSHREQKSRGYIKAF